jgi:hypothetical protein
MISSRNDVGKTLYPSTKIKFYPYVASYMQINMKGIKDLTVRAET